MANRYSILVADPDCDHRTALRLCLELNGFQVLEAANGLEALGTARSLRPNLVLAAMEMPLLGGRELVVEMRRDKHLATIPVVAVTGREPSDFRQNGGMTGFNAYLTKPFRTHEVPEIIGTCLQEAQKSLLIRPEQAALPFP